MGLSPEARSALQTIGNAAIGVGLGMSVLVVAFIVSQFAAGQGSVTQQTSSPGPQVVTTAAVTVATATPAPPPSSTPSASPTAVPTPAAATARPTPSPSPSPAPDPLTVTAYSSGGKRYAAMSAPVDYVFKAPLSGTVHVRSYQLIDGEVRVGSFVPSLPFYPYVTLESADRRIIYRPGALNADTEVLVKEGDRAELGAPLFKIVGAGASSWRTFYDRGVTANVIVSVAALPSGAELDPVAFFTTR